MAVRRALSSGVCENFTYTSVPPRKSTPYGIPCQNSMENKPATLKTSENARKYHFLPRKSMFALRKNSTPLRTPFLWRCPLSDAQRLTALLASQQPIENHARHEHRREQIREQTETECDRKA